MESAEKFPWIPFYMNFADALLPYRNDRPKLIGKLRDVYSLLFNKHYYPADVDPFTVFSLFSLGGAERWEIIRSLMSEFSIAVDASDSCPTLMHPSFPPFRHAKRLGEETHIENLWQVFTSALALASQDTPQNREAFCAAFKQTPPHKQFRWYLVTGLFWIRPYRFISLDRRTRGFLSRFSPSPLLEKDVATISKNVPTGRTYLTLCDDLMKLFSSGNSPWSSFPELSQAALSRSSSSKEPEKTEKAVPASGKAAPDIPTAPQIPGNASYTRDDFLEQTFLEPREYDALTETLEHKKNLILQGPPGVGKTYIARRLAWALAGAKASARVKLIQFHQNTSYEDFIMGFRPVPKGHGFAICEGVFYRFCKQAEADSGHDYYLIIDEINRGNTSKIFGDMFMLLENDKRGPGNEVQLLYKDEKFSIPENLYIIGTMNTADRSLAMLDYALRRRFAFYDLKPAFSTEKFARYAKSLESAKLDALMEVIRQLNAEIGQDPALGEGFCIGHSYFSNWKKDEIPPTMLRTVVEQELIPLVREYWYDDRAKAANWSDKLRTALL